MVGGWVCLFADLAVCLSVCLSAFGGMVAGCWRYGQGGLDWDEVVLLWGVVMY